MTREEQKTIEYLKRMEITPDHEVDRIELKGKYLMLAKKYHPDTAALEYQDGKMFSLMKEAYDFLYDHVALMNETIHNLLYPGEQTHQYSWSFEEEPMERPTKEEEDNPNQQASYQGMRNPTIVKVPDRPTLFASVISILSPIMGFIMFILHRRITPKSSWLYFALAILGIVLNIVLLFFMV